MKLCFHSQLQSIPLVGIHLSWVLHVCPLGMVMGSPLAVRVVLLSLTYEYAVI